MDDRETARKLESLFHLDVDATHVYDEALEHVTDDDVRKHFQEFRDEHDYHATVIAAEIRRLGQEPPKPREDLVGDMAEWVTAIRSRGTEGALHAMRSAERYHNKKYRETQDWSVDATLKEELTRFYTDEQRHLDFCEKRIEALAKA